MLKFTFEELKTAWTHSPDSKGKGKAPGIDNQTPENFKINLQSNLNEMLLKLNSNQYSFSSLKYHSIPKNDNEFRIICIPTVKDRLVQRVLNKRLYNYFQDDNKINFAKKGTSVAKAINKATENRDKKPWVVKTDIAKFFDNIDRLILLDKINNHIIIPKKEESIISLLKKAINCEVESNKNNKLFLKENGIIVGKGLRQGMPLSPALTDIFLKDFDKELIEKGLDVIRFADDIVVFADSRHECLEIMTLIKVALHKIKLNIVENSKTAIISPKKPVIFLGIEISWSAEKYKKKIPKFALKKTLEKLNSYTTEYVRQEKLTLPYISQLFKNTLYGYNGHYKDTNNWEAFQEKFNKKCNSVINSLMSDIIGKKFKKLLDDEGISLFLGIIPMVYKISPKIIR